MQIFRSFKPVPWEETVVVSPFEREKKKKKKKKTSQIISGRERIERISSNYVAN